MKSQLKIRTEYSFRWAYGQVDKVVSHLKTIGCEAAAITDRNSTFGHFAWAKQCKRHGIRPMFGAELGFVPDLAERNRRQKLYWMSLIARNNAGLREIYSALEEATSNFYLYPRLPMSRIEAFTSDVIILSGNSGLGEAAKLNSSVYREGHPATASPILQPNEMIIPVSDNYMVTPEDRSVYQILTGRLYYDRPSPMYIMDEWALRMEMDILENKHFELANKLASECDAEIQSATNIEYRSNLTLEEMCAIGAETRGIELAGNYLSRLQHELKIIKEKNYQDYFFVIADMVQYAKQILLVGPGRGSSCGSLVCYLLGITDIDPLVHGLIFERFIDVTRFDLPDIDIDFQDDKREKVFEYLDDKYGSENVARLGTITKYKPKSAINDAAKALKIPDWESDILKTALITRNAGDTRATKCIEDTYSQTEIGKKFIEKYPAMKIACDLEGHSHHTGKHAAGVVITNEPIRNFVAKDLRANVIQIDKYDAEKINLMKIDALGLKTLSIISDCLDAIGWKHSDLLKYPLDDDEAFSLLRNNQFCGVFQFEGYALQKLCKKIEVDRFTDIVAITALARPGPLNSGTAMEWVNLRTSRQEQVDIHPLMQNFTSETYGTIVFQEQVMNCAREIGKMTWKDTMALRKAMGKSLGVEYFNTFWELFKEGAISQQISEEVADKIWNLMNKHGAYSFNKSHAVAYAMVSYWCLILKANFPTQFALATFRNTDSPRPIKKYLRELYHNGFDFKPYDLEIGEVSWTFKNNTFIGGMTNIKGIANKKAEKFIQARETGKEFKLPDKIQTPYDNIFECRQQFPDLLDDPSKYQIKQRTDIIQITERQQGYVCIVAKVIERNTRSLNEAVFLAKRGNILLPDDKWLALKLEDDSGEIFAMIPRFKYPSLGVNLLKNHQLGDWFIFGAIANEGRLMIEKYKYLGSGTVN